MSKVANMLNMVKILEDGKIHTISCKIKGHVSSKKDGIEPGERLEF